MSQAQPPADGASSTTAASEAIAAAVIGGVVGASSPAVSPDGTQIAFVVTRTDLDKNTYRSQVWLTPADASRPPRPITSGEHNDSQPVWAPDGSALAFVSSRSPKKGEATLHLLPIDGPGEVRTVATMPDGIGSVS
ncbi:MAG TPA: hypothetical protein PLV68_15115, partial [Ilumatobacteraceae bacterium]|nr:hypothetical protein [Ilumatobacteraceae bacterium]